MKKIFTLSAVLLIVLSSGAQEARKVWDFTKGFSDVTVANLSAAAAQGLGWTDKIDGGSTTDNCYFETKARSGNSELTCVVDGEDWVIPETEGLLVGAASNQHFNIVYNETNGGYIWLNGKKSEDFITVPSVPAGDTVTVVFSSHSNKQARGFKVSGDSGFGQKDDSSIQSWTSIERDTVVLKNFNENDADLKIMATNGFHIHYICVGAIPEPEYVDPTIPVAYLYDSSYEGYSADADVIRSVVLTDLLAAKLPDAKVTDIDVSNASGVDADSLKKFNVVVVGGAIAASNAFVSVIKDALAYVPVLNFNANLYEAWGYGSAVSSDQNAVKIKKAYLSNSMFVSSETGESYINAEDSTLTLFTEGGVKAVKLTEGGYFDGDDIVATIADAVAMHIHNPKRNAYMYMPYPYEVTAYEQNAVDILPNAVVMLNKTKKEIIQTSKPQISFDYHNLSTSVILDGVTPNSTMYYTIDGSEPTMSSTLYTEPFEISTTGVIVKAVAIADGYTLSDVAEKEVGIYETNAQPTITVAQETGKSIVTITPPTESDVVYYNFSGSKVITNSTLYDGPLTFTKSTTIYAFTGPNKEKQLLASDPVSAVVSVSGEKVREQVIGHFAADQTNWKGTGTYFVGKTGYSFYTDEVIDTKILKDINGNDSIVNVYAPADSLYTYNPGDGWEFKTYGQSAIWQSNTVSHVIGEVGGYNPARAEDDSDEITNGCFQILAVGTSNADGVKDPASACLQTTTAYQAPFDVVSYISGNGGYLEMYVSTDTTNADGWTKVGDLISRKVEGNESGRLFAKTILPYEGTDLVYLKFAAGDSKATIFDIYIKNEDPSGIRSIEADAQGDVISTEIYSPSGVRTNGLQKGVNIIRKTYADGKSKTMKVMVK